MDGWMDGWMDGRTVAGLREHVQLFLVQRAVAVSVEAAAGAPIPMFTAELRS